MRTIRSLLWIGSGEGLARSGLTEAPELDVTWVPDAAEAAALPRVLFDGVLVEWPEALGRDDDASEQTASGRRGMARLEATLAGLERFAPRRAVILVAGERAAERLEPGALGIGALFVVDPGTPGPGFVAEVNEALDRLLAAPASASPSKGALETPSEAPRGASRCANGAARSDGAAATANERARPDAEEAEASAALRQLVCRSEAMRAVEELISLAARSPSTVLVTGETGVGKEVVARSLHERSARDEAPFLAVNCAAFPDTLLESELFGHEKGAFTGAHRAKRGLFEAAGAGTLFLDEIAETTLALQAKLLRVLQEREVRPVGGHASRPITCRIVAATNRDLAREVAIGRFREDLYYRLNVFPIRIPPLRERRADVLPLARRFLARHGPREGKPDCHLSLAAGHLLEAYHWPGNVRELENEVLRALMLVTPGSLITPRDLSPKLAEILEPIAEGAAVDETLREALERIEAWLIRRALANNGGRKARTARRLGLTREGLYKKLRRLGIE